MKINWGTGIAIFLVFFIGMCFLALYKSLGVDRSLVRDDYYQEDINYQQKYDKIRNALSSSKLPITINKQENTLEVDFSGYKNATGEIYFYRPSDASLDLRKPISLKDSKYSKDLSSFKKGKWRIKIDFTHDGKQYYTEQQVFL